MPALLLRGAGGARGHKHVPALFYQATRRRRALQPSKPRPADSISQVSASGTAEIVARPP